MAYRSARPEQDAARVITISLPPTTSHSSSLHLSGYGCALMIPSPSHFAPVALTRLNRVKGASSSTLMDAKRRVVFRRDSVFPRTSCAELTTIKAVEIGSTLPQCLLVEEDS